MRHLIVWLVGLGIGLTAFAQTQSFNVAIVKRAELWDEVGSACRGVDAGPETVPQGRCGYSAVSLKSLIMSAYAVRSDELAGTTGWMNSDLYTIEGVALDTETVKQQELVAMRQRQIEDTFKLKYHRETRTVLGYALTVSDEKKLVPIGEQKIAVQFTFKMVERQGVGQISGFHGQLRVLPRFLSSYLNAPVKDATGLTTRYAVELDLGRETNRVERQVRLFALLAEKGLKLTAETMALDYMVIESAEKPGDIQYVRQK